MSGAGATIYAHWHLSAKTQAQLETQGWIAGNTEVNPTGWMGNDHICWTCPANACIVEVKTVYAAHMQDGYGNGGKSTWAVPVFPDGYSVTVISEDNQPENGNATCIHTTYYVVSNTSTITMYGRTGEDPALDASYYVVRYKY